MAIRYYYSKSASQEAITSGGVSLLYPWHMHMCHWTLGLVRRGMVELATPAGMRQMKAGGFFLIPPRIPHSLHVAGQSEFLTLCINEGCRLQYKRASFPGESQLLLPREYSLLVRMIDQRIRQIGPLKGWQNGSSIRKLAQHLVEQPTTAFSLVEMARIACASPWHFLRRFKSETGMTPHAFLINCKIRHVRSLLRDRRTAADASVLAGFADQSHMHKLFKLHHNLTPRQFVLANSALDDAIR